MKIILEWDGDQADLLNEDNGMSLQDNIIYAIEQKSDAVLHNNIKITMEGEKPYWAKFYEVKKAEPITSEEVMTALELVELGYNMAHIADIDNLAGREKGSFEAGYQDDDGEIALYDLTMDELKTWKVEVISTDYDADGYPIINARLLSIGEGEKNNNTTKGEK